MLDYKLRDILLHADVSNNRADVWSEAKLIAQIKQAFADEGYHRHGTPIIPDINMTGQEWYDRFEIELGKPFLWLKATYPEEVVKLAARKAAGLGWDADEV